MHRAQVITISASPGSHVGALIKTELNMPQVYFSTTTFTGRDVKEDCKAFVQGLVKTRFWMKYIDDPMNICKVEGFREAAARNFNNYHLHHKGGQFMSREVLIKRGHYYRQPPEFLMFVQSDAHTRLHAILNEIERQM